MITIILSQHTDGTNVAEAIWNDTTFRAETHGGATHEVARKLVKAGAEDQPWQAVRGSMVCLVGKSLHRWAGLKTTDTDSRFCFSKWHPLQWQKAPTQRDAVDSPEPSRRHPGVTLAATA
jgi:hypothetical protein